MKNLTPLIYFCFLILSICFLSTIDINYQNADYNSILTANTKKNNSYFKIKYNDIVNLKENFSKKCKI